MATTFDVLFLGAGPGGYVGAIRAAQLGLTVGVVEKDKPGGVCVNIGCIPTKALLHSAEVANLLRHAKDLGVTTGEVSTDYGVAMKRSRRVSEQNSRGVEFLFKKHQIELIHGTGKLLPGRKIAVTPASGAAVELTATKAVVVATGSRPKDLPQLGLKIDHRTMISSDEALFLEAAPRSIAIVGAGAVGCEFADIFNAFGAQVTLLEVLPRILPVEDGEMSDVVAKAFRRRGITVHAGAQIQAAAVEKDGATITFTVAGKAETLKVEKILIATGRAPNTEGIGLEAAGVKLTDRGFIQVGPAMQTTAAGVYAIGDVAGPPLLAHKGSREGIVAAEAIAGQHPHPIDYTGVPGATYCHPEVASVGLTEERCKEQKLDYAVGRFPFSANGRARTAGETDGLVKIIRGKKYGEILGAHIAGPHATELIHELVVARANEYTVEEIELAIHAHPTLSEAVAEAALDAMGRVIHI
ncbi:MAG TPA: dihydrolipoyl dehydrogenase [Gemmatimonadales bacterium]|nr:dihydrolipoyl dehydrogenase [Gemmatimonadales bacterium]